MSASTTINLKFSKIKIASEWSVLKRASSHFKD